MSLRLDLLLGNSWLPCVVLFIGAGGCYSAADNPRTVADDMGEAAKVFCAEFSTLALDEVADQWVLPASREKVLAEFRNFFSKHGPSQIGSPVLRRVVGSTAGSRIFGVWGEIHLVFPPIDSVLDTKWVREDGKWFLAEVEEVEREP
jgi:hypothetical protein